MNPAYCECKPHFGRRSDCRRGDQCQAILVALVASPRPAWALGRWGIGAVLALLTAWALA